MAAGAIFGDIGLPQVAADPPPADAILANAIAEDRLIVARSGADIVGYLWWGELDGEGHIEQVSVHPRAGRKGIGRALVDEACRRARAIGHQAMSLTTFRDVAWNGPLYQRYGFSIIEGDDIGPELAERRRTERAAGLDVLPRVAMRRRL